MSAIRAKARCRVCGHLVNVKSVDGEVVTLVAHSGSYSCRCTHNRATLQDVREWIAKEIIRRREMINQIPEMKATEEDRHRRALKDVQILEKKFTKEHAALEKLAAKYR